MKKIKKLVSLVTSWMLLISIGGVNVFASEISENEPDVYAQELVENTDIEGVNYTFEYYYNENSDKSVLITDETGTEEQILTFNEETSSFYLNGEKVGEVETSDISDKDGISTRAVNTRWKLTAGPVHLRLSWIAGTTSAVVLAMIAAKLGIGAVYVKTAVGTAGLSALAACCSGGTLHYSKYYRNLALGQVQYKTNWSFVASTGDRYGTYTYLSTPKVL